MAESPHPEGSSAPRRSPRWLRRALVGARLANIFAILEVVSAIALVGMAVTSWMYLSSPLNEDQLIPAGRAAFLLVGTLIPAMALLVLLGRRLAVRRAAGAPAHLYQRLVFFFSLVAAIPTLLVAVFASFLFQTGVSFWFSDNSRGILENANRLAQGYYEETQLEITNTTIAMASDLRFIMQDPQYPFGSDAFSEQFYLQLVARELTESAILQEVEDGGLRVAAIAYPAEDSNPAQAAAGMFDQVRAGEEVAFTSRQDRIEALTPISRDEGIYLYNARGADADALSQWERAQSVVAAYEDLTARARTLQLNFNLALFAVSLALVGLAVWFALRFADRQVRPLTELVGAARRVGEGNFSMRVEGRTGSDEIGLLNRAFNRMTAQIEQQTGDLVAANRQLDSRRAFIEAVLESITAGIISTDRKGRVLLMNSSAQTLLISQAGPTPVGQALAEIAPEIADLLDAGFKSGLVQYKKGGELLTLAVKLAPSAEGHVITVEDITRQLLDQRQAAWSDVARRIAHEIKNPLTPIQLATERLKRRYREKIHEDPELFDELTSTIVRQVGDLRKMVDEFSSFARLPKPVFRPEDSVDLVRQALFLQEVARPDIDFSFSSSGDKTGLACDRHQFGQAATNVLKNAIEAIDARAATEDADYRGKIEVEVLAEDEFIEVAIADNGIGLPADRERIVEPYVTTREKGTGLGLAIVNKIVEEHGGEMLFSSQEGGGSRVAMRFARSPSEALAGSEAAE